jgi:hypothetical protein
MTRWTLAGTFVLAASLVTVPGAVGTARAQEKSGSMAARPVPQTAEWQKLRSLVG